MTRTRTPQTGETREVATLIDVVEQLRGEVKFLRMAIDEFREDFTHCLRNLPDNLPPPYAHLGTMLAAFSNEPIPSETDEANVGADDEAHAEPAPVASQVAPVVPQPVLPTPVKTPTTNGTVAKPTARAKKQKQPLYMRMVFIPLLTQIVQLTGYERWPTKDLKERLKPLTETHTKNVVNEAIQELLVCDSDQHWRLSDEAVQHAAQILGKRPTTPSVSQKPATQTETLSPAEAILLFEQHLKTTKQRNRPLKAPLLKRFQTERLTLPDFVLGNDSLLELILVRKELSADEESVMQRWVELIGKNVEATIVWPHREGNAYAWQSTIIAASEDRTEENEE